MVVSFCRFFMVFFVLFCCYVLDVVWYWVRILVLGRWLLVVMVCYCFWKGGVENFILGKRMVSEFRLCVFIVFLSLMYWWRFLCKWLILLICGYLVLYFVRMVLRVFGWLWFSVVLMFDFSCLIVVRLIELLFCSLCRWLSVLVY